MHFAQPLVRATLLRRYKRFLADVTLPDGREVTAHCANPGAMTGLAVPGTPVWLEPAPPGKRKLDWSWRLAELPGPHFAAVDTGLANRVVAEALAGGALPALAPWPDMRAEVRYGAASRADFRLEGPGLPPLWLEVKSVTLCRTAGLAEFPDTVSARGARHLAELAARVAAGDRAVLLYLVQRTDCTRVATAADIDPAYHAAMTAARAAGVEVMAHAARIAPGGISLGAPVGVVPPLHLAGEEE
ncbi:DNA/RNA nuclease SfsA [Paroceanicella profunda]|uniref:Sugar fermentation stimulation protein homolog n=1 Tax=Paroceanicella profunda TaxID=2579971 RepID=A0A5B8FUI7_9RHOB|nr:DNA/RNA nuclease SfsA [Paroceanicella profunda]QDL92045.1 DNA/RNA nuclease SfsA [Paroceanicella profunda]